MSSAPPPDARQEEPRRFGGYLLLKELGRGAQGVVFLAEDVDLRRKVALKMLTGAGAQSQLVRDRFRREAELTSKFEHPGICGVHDFGEVDGLPYIAMQYVRGTTLATIVEKAREGSGDGADAGSKATETITIVGGGSKGGLEDVLRLVERAARALHVAHEAGLVHRDVKPANIMVTLEGHPVMLDFGLARDLEQEGQGLTQSGQILGTPAYLAPEQIVATRGAVDRRTDVYALGVTLFECLTLRRPFESATWDQLFHEILDGAPRNPRALNPRIPHDLATVIEVAMDRDPARRYPSAEALAEDLRRVRSFEPIQAKAAGPLTRLRKWSRRSPGRAASAAAGVLFAVAASSAFVVRGIQKRGELRDNLQEATDALVAADYVRAAVAVEKAKDLDPESPQVLELIARVDRARVDAEREAERQKALLAAAAARAEAQQLGASYAEARRKSDELEAWILAHRSSIEGRYAPEPEHEEFSAREDELELVRSDADLMLLRRRETLERAVRLEDPWGGASAATLDAMAAFYMERWREAVGDRDRVRARSMRTAVELYDVRRAHEAELLGRGTLAFTVAPPAAETFLFRFEEYGASRAEPVIPRLVPVATSGVGRAHAGALGAGFLPGDPCLVVREVEAGSIAESAGLRPGDLVLRYGSAPACGSLLVREAPADGALAANGVAPLARVAGVDGRALLDVFDWILRMPAEAGALSKLAIEGRADVIECDARTISVASAQRLIEEPAPAAVRIECLRGDQPRSLEVPAGARVGLRCEATAYPLVLGDANRVEPGVRRTVEPGSYLLVARAPGFEQQRFLVVVDPQKSADARIELLPRDGVPEGFVHVPAGPYVAGGDARAFRPREAHVADVPGFFIARKELSNREWYEFLADPATIARIDATKPGEHLYLPQDDRVMAKRDPATGAFTWDVYRATSAETPVLGLTWLDVRDYLAWRNRRAESAGDPWRYELPTDVEWEKAARGVDARLFPWGDRFDPALAVSLFRREGYLLDAPGGAELRDESPYGVLDMAGSREEWLADVLEGTESPRARKRGGWWGSGTESVFHSASRSDASQNRFASAQGVRLVARRAVSTAR